MDEDKTIKRIENIRAKVSSLELDELLEKEAERLKASEQDPVH